MRLLKSVFAFCILFILAGGGKVHAAPLAYLNSDKRPVFLAWPLPSYIGPARISQYPNSPWTWNFLGLNPGEQCPPAFGYLLNLDSRPTWRDPTLPEEQDMAQADPHNFEMVECYATDGLPGANGHEGTDMKAPAGTPVHAAADGKVMEWRLVGLNNMLVLKHCVGGSWDAGNLCIGGTQWYTTYMHIDPDPALFQENLDVAQGAQLGTIYDQTINSHLHFEVGIGQRKYTNYVNPWGRDTAPWFGCMWLDASLCPAPNPGFDRLALYTANQRLFIQADGGQQVEVHAGQGVRKVQLSGERIAVLDEAGTLWVRDGAYQRQLLFAHDFLARWNNLGGGITDFQISGERLAILSGEGVLSVMEGSLDGAWVAQAGEVAAFSLSAHRLGILTKNGDLYVKQGSLSSGWIALATGARALQVVDNRIAYVDSQGRLMVNEGDLSAEWQDMGASVQDFQVTPLRVALLDTQGNLLVKEGNLRAKWLSVAQGVRDYQVSDYWLLIVDADGRLKIKQGNLYQDWSEFPYGGVLAALTNTGAPVRTTP